MVFLWDLGQVLFRLWVKAIEEGKPVYARELALLSAFYGVTADSLICHEEKGRGV